MSKGIEKHIKTLRRITGVSVQVGWFGEDYYENGQSVAEVMQYHEYGNAHYPARPILRQARAKFNKEVGTNIHKLTAKVVSGEIDPEELPNAMGELFVATVRLEFDLANFEGNKRRTIMKKGFDKPMTETGLARETVNYKVIKK